MIEYSLYFQARKPQDRTIIVAIFKNLEDAQESFVKITEALKWIGV